MKSNEALYKAIGEIKEEYIPDTEKKKRKPVRWAVIGGVTAAAAALGIFFTQGASIITPPVKEREPIFPASCYDPDSTFAAAEKLPLQDTEYRITIDSQSASVIDPSWDNGNPWKEETAPEALPVFKRLDFYGRWDSYVRRCFTEEQLRDIAEKAVSALGESVTQSRAVYDREGYSSSLDYALAEYFRENNMPMYFKAECSGEKYGTEKVTVSAGNGFISVFFSDIGYDSYQGYPIDSIPLPINGGIEGSATEEDLQRAVKYITDSFSGLIQYNNPAVGTQAVEPFSGHFLDRSDIRIFDMTDNDILNILNYNFSYTAFAAENETNGLYQLDVHNDLSAMEYLGDYPVTSPAEVREMLINEGYYIYDENLGYVKADGKVKAEDVKKIELSYNNDTYTGICAPYYRIYIDTEDSEEGTGCGSYLTLCVPAVRKEYAELSSEKTSANLNEEVLNAIPYSEVDFPDGSREPKENAIASGENAQVPELTFNFAFIRFAKPEYRSTLDDPDCYDFEKGEGKETPDYGVSKEEWCRVKNGDVITGDLSVKYAETKAIWYGEGERQELYEGRVEFDGTLTAEGILCRSDDASGLWAMFFPTPESAWKVPIAYTSHRDKHWITLEDGNAFITDSDAIWIKFDELPECFDGKQTVKVRATLENITLAYNESANGFTAEFKDYEILG